MKDRKYAQPLEAEDLLARARQGTLSVEEHEAFERALETSATVRVAHLVGRDFDDARGIRTGDDELIQRACAKVLGPRVELAARRRVRAIPAVALLLVASGAAATSAWLVVPRSNAGGAPSSPAASSSSQPAGVSPAAPGARVASADHLPTQTQAVEVPTPGALSEQKSRSGAASSRPPTNPVRSAATLFRDANAARRVGDVALARALYGELQASFPETREARVSRVSLGKLCLGSGLTREAERQFRQYLATGGGDLAEEALVGRAEALARLGEIDEERRVWQQLQRTHPSSVYSERASRRIQALAATGSAPGPQR